MTSEHWTRADQRRFVALDAKREKTMTKEEHEEWFRLAQKRARYLNPDKRTHEH